MEREREKRRNTDQGSAGLKCSFNPLLVLYPLDIIVGGLYNVINTRNALSEHFNVVRSTNIVRRALHEVGLG